MRAKSVMLSCVLRCVLCVDPVMWGMLEISDRGMKNCLFGADTCLALPLGLSFGVWTVTRPVNCVLAGFAAKCAFNGTGVARGLTFFERMFY